MRKQVQKKDWEKSYSLLVNIIQCKDKSFQLAFILDPAFVQVYTLSSHMCSKPSPMMNTT